MLWKHRLYSGVTLRFVLPADKVEKPALLVSEYPERAELVELRRLRRGDVLSKALFDRDVELWPPVKDVASSRFTSPDERPLFDVACGARS